MFEWLKSAWDRLIETINNPAKIFINGWTWLMAALTAYIITPAKMFWDWISDSIDSVTSVFPRIKDAVEGLNIGKLGEYWSSSALVESIGIASNWFPFDFALACFTGLCVLWAIALSFRMLRSLLGMFIG